MGQCKAAHFAVGEQPVVLHIAYFRSKLLPDDAPLVTAMTVFKSAKIFDPLRLGVLHHGDSANPSLC